MKTTLLTLVQHTLRAMNSDEVDALDDTEEALQVAQIAEDVFYELLSLRDWGHKKEVITLDSSADNTQPTRMKLPEGVLDIEWVRYDKRLDGETVPRYVTISYCSPDDFLERCLNRDIDADNIMSVDDNIQDFTFAVYTDRGPEIYTSFDDEYLWFDSYDSEVDSILQSNKTIVHAVVMPTFTMTDSAVPDIPNKDWALYKSMVIARAFEEIKQVQNPSRLSTARRLLIRAQKENGQRVDGQYPGVNYGRT